jgi:hypothetical protein
MRRSTGLQSWSRRSRHTMASVMCGSVGTPASSWRPWPSIATTSSLCSSRWSLRICFARGCAWCPPAHQVLVPAGHSGGTTPRREQARGATRIRSGCVGRGRGDRQPRSSRFAASLDRQKALAFCWIAVGGALKDYAHIAKLPARQEPLSSPIRFRDRISHQSLSQLDADVLWRVSTERVSDLRPILIIVRAAGQ